MSEGKHSTHAVGLVVEAAFESTLVRGSAKTKNGDSSPDTLAGLHSCFVKAWRTSASCTGCYRRLAARRAVRLSCRLVETGLDRDTALGIAKSGQVYPTLVLNVAELRAVPFGWRRTTRVDADSSCRR